MAVIEGVHVFKRGFKDPVYTAARQYIALEKSIEMLEYDLKWTEYGENYKKILKSRIEACRKEMDHLETKYSLDKIEEFKKE